jgi:hypothetical protein
MKRQLLILYHGLSQIPTHIMLSDTCKDLLIGLLQRNPNDRISFERFFNHPFVDLDHMPNANCLTNAVVYFSYSYKNAKILNCLRFIKTEILNRAVRADENKDYITAQRFYLQSVEYLIPAIQCI